MIFLNGKLNWIGLARDGLISLPEPEDLPPVSQDIDPGRKPFLEIVEDEETGELLTVRNDQKVDKK